MLHEARLRRLPQYLQALDDRALAGPVLADEHGERPAQLQVDALDGAHVLDVDAGDAVHQGLQDKSVYRGEG